MASQEIPQPKKDTASFWAAGGVHPQGYLLGGGIESRNWRFGVELFRAHAGGLFDQQISEHLVGLTVSRLLASKWLYLKGGFGHAKRWTDGASSTGPFAMLGIGVVAPPSTLLGLRVSVDVAHNAASPPGQYPSSVFVGLGVIVH